MYRNIKQIGLALVILLGIVIGYVVNAQESTTPKEPDTPTCEIDVSQEKAPQAPAKTPEVVLLTNLVNPLSVVHSPSSYLGRRINVSAKFNKFSTLGLDYKPAMRSSENYISFLIFRPEEGKTIPLSEMKLFVKRTLAEKHIELKEGDTIQFSGVVFSNALGDVWVDVDRLDKIK